MWRGMFNAAGIQSSCPAPAAATAQRNVCMTCQLVHLWAQQGRGSAVLRRQNLGPPAQSSTRLQDDQCQKRQEAIQHG
jgi:hypothetical protein